MINKEMLQEFVNQNNLSNITQLNKAISEMIPDIVFPDKMVSITEFGNCVCCGKNPMKYTLFSNHTRLGDKWFEKRFSKPVGEFEIESAGRSAAWKAKKTKLGYYGVLKINGIDVSTKEVEGYICKGCAANLQERLAEVAEVASEKAQAAGLERQQQAEAEDQALVALLLSPETTTEQVKRLNLRSQSSALTASLKKLPYKTFLETGYWKMVRYTALQRDNFKCRTCASKTGLNVHHNSYANHGEEALNLDDLTTLCFSCHGKYHNK